MAVMLFMAFPIPAYSSVPPLHDAAEKGDTATVKDLLSAGADPNARTEGENGWTPLHWAKTAIGGNSI